MKKMFKRALVITTFIMSTALVFGCSEDEIIGTGFDTIYNGAAHKGPFVINSKVEVQPLTSLGLPTGQVIITETTNSLGNFKFNTTHKGPVKIATEGYHLNELTGELSGGTLRLNAIVDINGDNSKLLLVNVLIYLIH